MKFAKGLEESIVPEWRVKYIDYKGGKKKIKNVAKAIKYAQASPAVNSLYINAIFQGRGVVNASRSHNGKKPTTDQSSVPGSSTLGWIASKISATPRLSNAGKPTPGPQDIPESTPLWRTNGETASIGQVDGQQDGLTTQYGSIQAAPDVATSVPRPPPSLHLPDPMQPLNTDTTIESREGRDSKKKKHDGIKFGHKKLFPISKHKPNASATIANSRPALLRRVMSSKVVGQTNSSGIDVEDLREEAQNEFFRWMEAELAKIDGFYRMKEEEAVQRLEELREQLHIMRDMRVMEFKKTVNTRNESQSNLGEAVIGGAAKVVKASPWNHPVTLVKSSFTSRTPSKQQVKTTNTLERITTATSPTHPDIAGNFHPGFTANHSHSASNTGITSGFLFRPNASQRDYAQRNRIPTNEINYRVAKRKLKSAMIEYYRGLELLKSYCHQNREGFRKINKKFDKATGLRTSKRFMTEKVNKSYFGSSEVLENIIFQTEDLFSRYFERGDRKHAVERLRTKEKNREFYASTFRSGIFLGLAAFAGIQGLVVALKPEEDGKLSERNTYLLQIWAGFFLPLLFVLLFALNCRTWARSKINYVFCFEFDTRHNLDYRQFLEIPSFLAFMLSLIFWLNFADFWPNSISSIHYPIIFLALSLGVVFNPFPILYHRSRRWFAFAHWRLLLSGLYPVEFRDFWLGDMFCSQTYTMGNIALFSCLYKGHWDDPGVCNSSRSRLLGFMTCLPGIWRLLQCFRRYRDTGNAFPHMANAGKYACTVLYYMSLSLWRIDKSEELKALFIALGTVNAVYCSIWDLAMDWSLLNPYAPWPFLRNELGFKNPWAYYAAILIDPILRFNWIFYVIFANDIQHSQSVSFFVSLAEIFRRWIWNFFRMENEHCTNVGNFRAYREVPLPYELPPGSPNGTIPRNLSESPPETTPLRRSESLHHHSGTSLSMPSPLTTPTTHTPTYNPQPPPPLGTRQRAYSAVTLSGSIFNPANNETIPEELPDLERQSTHRTNTSLRFRTNASRPLANRTTSEGNNPTTVGTTSAMRAWNALGTAFSSAHAQDFERRKGRPETGRAGTPGTGDSGSASEDDEDDDFEEGLSDCCESEEEMENGERIDGSGSGSGGDNVITPAEGVPGNSARHPGHHRHSRGAGSHVSRNGNGNGHSRGVSGGRIAGGSVDGSRDLGRGGL